VVSDARSEGRAGTEEVDAGEAVLLEKVRWTSNGLVEVSVSGR
jgi:hypothetical protein